MSARNDKNIYPHHLQAKTAQSLNTFVKCEKGWRNLAGLRMCHNLCKNCLVYENKSVFFKLWKQCHNITGSLANREEDINHNPNTKTLNSVQYLWLLFCFSSKWQVFHYCNQTTLITALFLLINVSLRRILYCYIDS